MRRQAELPSIFQGYATQVRYVQQVSATEFSSSCPACGGDIHADGEWPDRCRWFLRGDKFAGWCRRCESLFFPDQADQRFDAQEMETWRREQERKALEIKRKAEQALDFLRSKRLWEQYHESLGAEGRAYWERRGIPPTFQDYWLLGWDPNHRIFAHQSAHYVTTATIPLFGTGWEARNIKHRIVNDESLGRYRYEIAQQGQIPFLCDPDKEIGEQVTVVEGEIKAMVTFITLDDAQSCVIGLPGTNPGIDLVEMLNRAQRVTLIMDPDGRQAAWKLVKRLTMPDLEVLIPPVKIDDGILLGHMNGQKLRNLIRQGSVPVSLSQRQRSAA